MLTAEKQTLLTRVGPDTPMGNLMRHYWFPILASHELSPGKAKPVRLLCEDLVVFRTQSGHLGLIERHCSHRRSSLECGLVDDQGIACPYHGWKFNDRGQCISMPAEKDDPGLREKAAIKGYSVQELGGLIFAYLGKSPAPLLPRFDLLVWEHGLKDIGRAEIPCNWLQIMENSVDPTHVEYLHGHHMQAIRKNNQQNGPGWYTKRHIKIGFDIFEMGIIKRRILEGGSEHDDDWKTGHPLIFPNLLRVGTQGQHRFQFRVPIDDVTTMHYWYSCYLPPPEKHAPQQDVIPLYDVPWQNPDGSFITDFVDGGDIMTWVTQGKIADRTREMLVSSDHGVVLYRKLLLDQLKVIEQGKDPMCVFRDHNNNKLIEIQQEKNKFKAGFSFIREALEISHARYSPIKNLILDMYDL